MRRLALVLALALAGCGGAAGPPASPAQTPSGPTRAPSPSPIPFSMDAPVGGSRIIVGGHVTASGLAQPGSLVSCEASGVPVGSVTTDASGAWSVGPLTPDLGLLALTCSEQGTGESASADVTVDPEPVLTVTDEDDGATGGDTGPLPSPAASTNPTATAAGRLSGEPRPALTPGAYNPAVTQATIGRTICVSGWTATIRPSSSYTTGLKIQQIAQYGYTDTSTASYEEDHLVPLELGGAPSDLRDLWPEPYVATLPDGRNVGARVKDSFENSLKRQVCAGTITLADARSRIGIHWVHAYYGIPLAAGATTPPPTARPTPRPTPKPTLAPRPASLSVTFVSLPGPAIPGSTASMIAKTSPGAVCSAKVTWPSGTVSAAAGLKTTPTAGSDGLVSWTWNVSATTKPGTAKAAVTCTLGGSLTATATFTVQ
jgi:hypothetical protein